MRYILVAALILGLAIPSAKLEQKGFVHAKQSYSELKHRLNLTETEELQERLQYWKQEFHMSDWNVQIRPASQMEIYAFTGQFAFGASMWDLSTRSGQILVLQRSAYSQDMRDALHIKSVRRDQENTIVHELFHNVWENAGSEEAGVAISANLVVPE